MNYAGSSSHEGVFLLLRRRIPLSQLVSIPPLTFLRSLFHSFKLIFSFSNTSISFTLNHVFQISASLPALSCMPPPPPRVPCTSPFLLSAASTVTFIIFFIFVLMLHMQSSSLRLSVFLHAYPCGWIAEQRKGREPVVLDSHKCVKEEKRKSYGLSSAPTAQVSLLKRPVTNV